MLDQLLETWAIHDRIHRYLLDAIPDAALGDRLNDKGRSVAAQFAHVHNVRLLWLKPAAPELLDGLDKLDPDADLPKPRLAAALEASGRAIGSLLRTALTTGGGKVKGFKPHAIAFLGYLISHESHHRGQIGWAIKHAGHPLDKRTAFGMWEWGTR
jgi:uncharacterized damage-inducible protein DinB